MIRYDNYVVYDNYDSRLQKMYYSLISAHYDSTNMLLTYRIETKFGVLGATNIQPCFMNPSLPLLLITRYICVQLFLLPLYKDLTNTVLVSTRRRAFR